MEFLEYNDVSAEIKGAMVNIWLMVFLKHANIVLFSYYYKSSKGYYKYVTYYRNTLELLLYRIFIPYIT